MSDGVIREDGNLGVAVAAWLVMLHQRGCQVSDKALSEAIAAVVDDATGEALVRALRSRLGAGAPPEVAAFAEGLFGDRVIANFGEGSREERVARARRFGFSTNAPWLARVYARQGDVARPVWRVVQSLTDEVLALDPDPFDGLDEELRVPLADFLVCWELDGCTAVVVRPC